VESVVVGIGLGFGTVDYLLIFESPHAAQTLIFQLA
jgi:hypothetical protein